jgi:hypothetical protein
LFHPRWWRRNFEENGFAVVADEPMGLFYTAEELSKSHNLVRIRGHFDAHV